jgi:hypothetical protein
MSQTQGHCPDGPSTSPYPQECAAMDPFPIGTVWGIEQGWAVDPAQAGRTYNLALGTYRVTESITPAYTQLFGIPRPTPPRPSSCPW